MRFRSNNMRAVDTQEKVDFLRSPTTYPDNPVQVDVIETHMSWVFLTDKSVFKLKKPVKYPFLDFSTVAAREADCRTEVLVNQRLAPGIYLGVVTLTLEADAKLALNGSGEVIDWLVKMRRLPADRMLDQVIVCDTVSRTDIEKVADVLADFYRCAQPADLRPDEYVTGFADEQTKNASVLTMTTFDLPKETVSAVLEATGGFIAQESEILAKRVRDDHVVEGHGDLRPEHICLLDPPVIIDCLEFNRRLRLVDPFDELAFLGLECARLGAGWMEDLVTERCGRALGDRPSGQLIAFYTAFRASLRARLALAHLLEPKPREPDKWLPLARQYLAIAERASVRIFPQGVPQSIPPHGAV